MKRIPIKAAKKFLDEFEKDQIAIVCWDRKSGTIWVTTHGRTLRDALDAAVLGNRIKREVLLWPENLCNAMPARVLRARKRHAKTLSTKRS